MSATVTIVDYGLGNLCSVTRAVEHCGGTARLAREASEIDAAERLILPGVGAFADGMAGLRSAGLIEPIRRFGASGKPFLGICLGMQMMFERSEEFGDHAGLALIPGKVVSIPATGADGVAHKIPHIGWNALETGGPTGWTGSLLRDLRPGQRAYFVHSFMASPTSSADILARCRYNDVVITAAVQHKNLFGCQFHPEKSAATGLSIIRRFIQQ